MTAIVKTYEQNSSFQAFPPSTSDKILTIKEWFYQCHFRDVISSIDHFDWNDLTDEQYIELQILKSNALYEIHQASEAKQLLKALESFRKITSKGALLYAQGRLAYFDGDYAQAKELFSQVSFHSSDNVLIFRSLLGVANVFYSTKEFEKIPPVLAKLEQLKNQVNEEDRVSLLILLGNYYRSSSIDRVMARRYFELALGASSQKSWNYFVNRCLYGLATVEQRLGRTDQMHCILNILKASLQKSEAKYFKYLVNEKFKEDNFSLDTPIKIDHQNMRVKLNDRWYHFHAKPLLFRFLVVLESRKDFVTKADMAQSLWPNQRYLPRTHDPRIFDIAKRIRAIIEEYDNNPLVLLSGRQGYKLASKSTLHSMQGGHL